MIFKKMPCSKQRSTFASKNTKPKMGVDRAPARFQNKSNCKPCFYRRFCYFKKILTYDRPSVKFRSGKRSQFNTTQVSLLKKTFQCSWCLSLTCNRPRKRTHFSPSRFEKNFGPTRAGKEKEISVASHVYILSFFHPVKMEKIYKGDL